MKKPLALLLLCALAASFSYSDDAECRELEQEMRDCIALGTCDTEDYTVILDDAFEFKCWNIFAL